MRHLLSILLFLAIASSSLRAKPHSTIIDNILNSYKFHKYEIDGKALSNNLNTAFNSVVLANNTTAGGVSAFTITRNAGKTQAALNAAIKLYKWKNPLYLQLGLFASGSGDLFDFYGENEWKKGGGIKVGLVQRIGDKNGVWLSGDEAQFKRIHAHREYYLNLPLDINYYSSQVVTDLTAVKDALNSSNCLTPEFTAANFPILNYYPEVATTIKTSGRLKATELIDKITKEIESYGDTENDLDKAKKYFKTRVVAFDTKYENTEGYYFQWIDAGVQVSNTNYDFTSAARVDTAAATEFGLLDRSQRDQTMDEWRASVNFNFTSSRKKSALFWRAGFFYTSGSFLNTDFARGDPKVFMSQGQLAVQDGEERLLGNYDDLTSRLKTAGVAGYFGMFFNKTNTLGINFSGNYTRMTERPNGVTFDKSVSALVGPMYRTLKDGKTALALNFEIGYDGLPTASYKAEDFFVVRFKVGIPFDTFDLRKANAKSE